MSLYRGMSFANNNLLEGESCGSEKKILLHNYMFDKYKKSKVYEILHKNKTLLNLSSIICSSIYEKHI